MRRQLPGSLLALALAALLSAGAVSPAQDGLWFCSYYQTVPSPGPGITKYAFDGTVIQDVPLPSGNTYSAAVDYAQNVWVTTSSSFLYKIDSQGKILLTISTGPSPQGVAVDAGDNVVVVSRGQRSVTKYSPSGTAVATAATPKGSLSAVVDVQGNVWVPAFDIGSGVPFEVYKYDGNLANRITFSFTPNSSGSFGMSGIATDTSGDVYVANQDRSTVMRISATGTVVWETKLAAGYARGVATDAIANVWAAGHAGRAVFQLRASDGRLLNSIASPKNYPLCGVLVDANSDVWSLGNGSSATTIQTINKWYRVDGTNLAQSNQRHGSTVATGDSGGYHSAAFLNGARDFDGDGFSNLTEAKAGSNYLDIFTTPKKPTPIISGTVTGGTTLYVGVRHLASAGKFYACAFSFGSSPGIPVPGVGTIPLNPDSLFFLSLLVGPPVFNNMVGGVGTSGDGLADVNVPGGLPSNLTLYTAFVTFDTTGIRTISNPAKLVTP